MRHLSLVPSLFWSRKICIWNTPRNLTFNLLLVLDLCEMLQANPLSILFILCLPCSTKVWHCIQQPTVLHWYLQRTLSSRSNQDDLQVLCSSSLVAVEAAMWSWVIDIHLKRSLSISFRDEEYFKQNINSTDELISNKNENSNLIRETSPGTRTFSLMFVWRLKSRLPRYLKGCFARTYYYLYANIEMVKMSYLLNSWRFWPEWVNKYGINQWLSYK